MDNDTKKVLNWIQSTLEPMAVLKGSYIPDDAEFERLSFTSKGSMTNIEVAPEFVEYLESPKNRKMNNR